ncbi:MAG TPA: hypothetical protein VGG71_10770, partial [Chitinophagaceae bacterium]
IGISMSTMVVSVSSLNRRSSPVINSDNLIDTVSKGYSFDSTGEITNATGTWYKDGNGYYYWSGGLAQTTLPAQPTSTVNFSSQQIQSGTGARSSYAQKFMSFINDTCNKYGINTPVRGLCFLAQIGHESGGLYYTEELASGSEYEGKRDLGNTQPGDGVRFKGRGLIQISGRNNYSIISKELGIDFISFPTLLGGKNADQSTDEQLKNASLSAGWFWNNHDINSIADKIMISNPIDETDNLENFTRITVAINGGRNGLNDRLARYKAGLQYFS